MKMHQNEKTLAISEVRKLIQEQFPRWSDCSLSIVKSFGTVNTIYRLGKDHCIRIPKIYSGVQQIEKERKWLTIIAEHLPLKVPKLVAIGKETSRFPWKWAVYEWIEGQNGTKQNLVDIPQNITILTGFLRALQAINTDGGPEPGEHNYYRGEPLVNRDQATRDALFKLRKGSVNFRTAERVWEEALCASVQEGERKWIHGDLQSGNMLAVAGKITAIIDFGALGVGDVAVDFMPAWNLFDFKERTMFRDQLAAQDSVWKRARGWALSVAVIALEYYMCTNPELAAISQFTIKEVEKDYAASG